MGAGLHASIMLLLYTMRSMPATSSCAAGTMPFELFHRRKIFGLATRRRRHGVGEDCGAALRAALRNRGGKLPARRWAGAKRGPWSAVAQGQQRKAENRNGATEER